EATRDYVLRIDGDGATAPVLNIFGGKLTTYRRLSQKAVDMIAQRIGAKGEPWTRRGTLPGGDFPATGFEGLVAELRNDYPALDAAIVRRLARAYETRARVLLGDAKAVADLGEQFGADLYA